MRREKQTRSIGTWLVSVVAVLFGLLTIKSGGAVLFIDGPDRVAAGSYVPFVLWFNFVAGFFYIVAGAGVFLQKRWAAQLAIGIMSLTLIVFVLLGLHVFNDGSYETRTVGAMTLRSVVWIVVALFTYRKFIKE